MWFLWFLVLPEDQQNWLDGSALTSISTIGYLGFLLVPPMVGFISEFLSMKWAFLVMALLGGLMILMVNKIGAEE